MALGFVLCLGDVYQLERQRVPDPSEAGYFSYIEPLIASDHRPGHIDLHRLEAGEVFLSFLSSILENV